MRFCDLGTSSISAYAGKILRVDLSSGKIECMDTADHARRFLGGRGVATSIYYQEVPPEIPYDHEDNRLIITMGPLCGMPGGLGGSRWGIFSKSPLPRAEHGDRDHFCYGNLGGSFGAELRFAGYDGIVVSGKADKPVRIAIEDDRVEILSADELWGLSTIVTRKALEDGAKAMVIGPAGEHGAVFASVFAHGDASCSGGMGAAMGAKNLKAISVRGSHRRVEVADRETLKIIDKQIRGYKRGNVKVWGLDFMAHGPKIKKMPCYACMGHCLRVRYTADDGDSGKFMCQSRFFYMNHAWGYYGADNDVPFHANRICDAYGVDTWEVQALIEWLLRCHAEGVLSEKETGLDLALVGSLEFVEDLVRMASLRQGFGELLSGGALSAARARGGRAADLHMRTDPYDPRYCTVNTLLFPFETREPIQQLHEAGLVLSQWSSWAKGVEDAHISSEVIRGIAERFWGSLDAADMSTLNGKAGAAKRIQERQMAKECMGICDWMFPLIDIPNGSEHIGDPTFESRILSAVLGKSFSETDLYRIGERVFNLQRAVLLREGHRAREDDRLPEEWHTEPVETHVADPELLAPGPQGQVISQLGRRAESAGYARILDEYYGLRAWDVPSGLQSVSMLRALDLADVAEDLQARGLSVLQARSASLLRRVKHWVGALRAGRRGEGGQAPAEQEPSVSSEELEDILYREQGKFGLEHIRDNFAGWNKTMQYVFPDIDECWIIRFVDGQAQSPEKLEAPLPKPEIGYEMNSWVLKAMSAGELSGEKAYLKRLLRLKASFRDMMKLQSLNKG